MKSDVAVDELLIDGSPDIVDVRSPGEFQHGHIPGSVSVPLFDNDQRAEIGTLYKQVDRQRAIARGLEIARQRSSWIVEQTAKLTDRRDLFLYCWRGGMRSEGVATLLRDHGFRPRRIRGGYKAYRRAAHKAFEQPLRLMMLAGPTGSGKTRILQQLRRAGQQILDLEGLANHRGSAFGAIDQPPQPTTEQFENNLFDHWKSLDPQRVVWIEGESKAIGSVRLPDAFWQQMVAAPMILVDCPRELRVQHLVEVYGKASAVLLAEAVQKIRKRLGGQRTTEALEAIARGDVAEVARTTLQYYDRAYERSRDDAGQVARETIVLDTPGYIRELDSLVELGERLSVPGTAPLK